MKTYVQREFEVSDARIVDLEFRVRKGRKLTCRRARPRKRRGNAWGASKTSGVGRTCDAPYHGCARVADQRHCGIARCSSNRHGIGLSGLGSLFRHTNAAMKTTTRLLLRLPKASVKRLRSLQERTEATSCGEVVRNAVRCYERIVELQQGGNVILLKDKEGNVREVLSPSELR